MYTPTTDKTIQRIATAAHLAQSLATEIRYYFWLAATHVYNAGCSTRQWWENGGRERTCEALLWVGLALYALANWLGDAAAAVRRATAAAYRRLQPCVVAELERLREQVPAYRAWYVRQWGRMKQGVLLLVGAVVPVVTGPLRVYLREG